MRRFRKWCGGGEGIAEAEVSSAIELSATQKAEFAFALEKLTGKRVEAKYSLEPKLLGGAVVRIGDTIYDGSLRSRLDADAGAAGSGIARAFCGVVRDWLVGLKPGAYSGVDGEHKSG